MTIESKKTFALIGCAMAAMVVVAGNILMALQIKTQGSGFYVGYLFYSLAILAGGVFITWLPNMKNLYGLFDYCCDLWQKPWTETLKYLFFALTLVAIVVWCGIIIVEDIREKKKNKGQL